MKQDKLIKFIPSGRGKAQCAPNPDYPTGVKLPCPPGTLVSCAVDLPYPAPECGMFMVECTTCNVRILITAAGRPDDPVRICLPCDIPKTGKA